MAAVPATPRRQATHDTTTTPQTSRVATSHVVQSSPHYTTTRRHSLYGTEDRIILDPGSRIWKVGFSGEGKPRDVFYAGGENGPPLWTLSRAARPAERDEQDRMLEARLQTCLRAVFHDSLLTDPKSRKVIVVEHPLLPLHIKDAIARILFNNLQVPSISFASSHLLSLLAAGRVTGLVLDCGHLEATALPIFSSRPLFPQLRTTPLAGARLSSHLRALLLLFGTYLPPPTSLSAAANIPNSTRSTRVPEEVLTDAVIEELKTRCCFVGSAFTGHTADASRALSPTEDDGTDIDIPPSDTTMSESEFERESTVSSSQHVASSGYSVVSQAIPSANTDRARVGESHLQALATMYMRQSTATDLQMRVEPPTSQQTGTGRGTLIVPGWIRERAAEVLFEGGDVDESSVAEVILDSLLKVPVDLRKTLASAILVVGGTPMLPGFIPRLHAELLRAISPPSQPSTAYHRPGRPRPSPYDRYAPLRPLTSYFAILNHPSPPQPTSSNASANAGKAPAFTPAALPWVGGSLAGALKTGGVEVAREKWDEADEEHEEGESPLERTPRSAKSILPDWTRTPLPAGAPPAVPVNAAPLAAASPQTAVGA